jgi:hypothetical protein
VVAFLFFAGNGSLCKAEECALLCRHLPAELEAEGKLEIGKELLWRRLRHGTNSNREWPQLPEAALTLGGGTTGNREARRSPTGPGAGALTSQNGTAILAHLSKAKSGLVFKTPEIADRTKGAVFKCLIDLLTARPLIAQPF